MLTGAAFAALLLAPARGAGWNGESTNAAGRDCCRDEAEDSASWQGNGERAGQRIEGIVLNTGVRRCVG